MGILHENSLHFLHLAGKSGKVKTGGMYGKGVKEGFVLCVSLGGVATGKSEIERDNVSMKD